MNNLKLYPIYFRIPNERKSFMRTIKIICSILLVFTLFLPCFTLKSYAAEPNFDCISAILVEKETGNVLFEQNADEALPPASVTKIMTLLLVMEAIEEGKIKLDDMVTASAHACSMGGSQIYLEEGEAMSVEEMIKSVVIASANDAAVALAEHIAGTEESFVKMMNERAAELGMKNTNFENTNGLDDTAQNHVTSARDIAIMSAKLLSYDKITEYSSIWMDTVRNGEFGLTNTNRLVRFYKGANGLKTGSTSKAKFCISASAERDGMTLIAVVMAAPTRDVRNAIATSLLDYGFANYTLYRDDTALPATIPVIGGIKGSCNIKKSNVTAVVKKSEISAITTKIDLPERIQAPIEEGQKIGTISYYSGQKLIECIDIIAAESVFKISFLGLLAKVLAAISLI